ncbi:MAG: metal ABC transporter substrate-binding protein [Chloroflexota bacterium]
MIKLCFKHWRVALVTAALLVSACGVSATTPVATPATGGGQLSTSPTPSPSGGEVFRLRMGLLPILDVIPFHVAQQNGYFKEVGLEVELKPVKSAQERDALLQAGEIDGMLNDLISTALFNQNGPQIKIVAVARRAYPQSAQYRILASPNSGITSPEQLKGVEIGISHNTVIEYITDRLLEQAGLKPEEIKTVEYTVITARYEALMSDQIKAATIPDPLASGAVAAGAKVVLDDTKYTQFSQSNLSFSVKTLQSNPEAVRRFLRAWNRAVDELNANPDKYRDVLIEQKVVPQAIQGTYQMPPFPKAEITSEAEWNDVIQWMMEKGLLKAPVAYKDAVDESYLEINN